MRSLRILCLVLCLSPVRAYAQSGEPVESARLHLGPVGITPSISFTTLTDSNVFRDEAGARRDVMVTASPASRGWLRAGRSRLSFEGRADFVYFRRYSGEGSLDGSIAGRYEMPVNRVTPWIEGRVVRGRQRLGYEIDARARHGESARGGGVMVRALSRTDIGAFAHTVDYRYGADARFVGADLKEALNRRATTIGVRVAQRLTPLTALVVESESIHDRFVFSTARDADSRRLLAGLDLAPGALISGRVRVGYREFDARASAAAFRGLVGAVDAAWTVAGRVRFAVSGQRDLEYSYDVTSPYYVRNGGQLTITSRLSPGVEIQARAGRQGLEYHDALASVVRVDRVDTYGGGIGYRVGDSLRIGVNVEREHRISVTHGRGFDGFRAGAALTYGG